MRINGPKIRKLRGGRTQEQVCGRGGIGISVDTLSERERDIGDLSDTKVYQSLMLIAQYHGVQIEELIIRDEGDKPFHALEEMYSTLIMLDRLSQWNSLTGQCEKAHHVVFFLNGATEQFMELFLARIPFKLGNIGSSIRQRVVSLPLNDGGSRLSTMGDWRSFLLRIMRTEARKPEEQLRRLAEEGPVLLVAGAPYGLDGLAKGEQEGLSAFIKEELPELLDRALPKFPVRLLLPSVDDGTKPWIYDVFRETQVDWTRQRETTWPKKRREFPRLTACRLAPLAFPSEDDIEDYVRSYWFKGSPEELEELLPGLLSEYREHLASKQLKDWRQIFLMIKRRLRRGGRDNDPKA